MQAHPGSSPRLSGVPQVLPQGLPRKEGLLPTPANPVALSMMPLSAPVVQGSKPTRRESAGAGVEECASFAIWF